MGQVDLDQLAKALNLSAAQRDKLESLARGAVQQGNGAPGAPSQASVRIHLTPGESLKAGAPVGRAQQQPFVAAALGRLSPDLRKTLQGIEPQVLAWINASPDNARQFTTDPLGALHKAVPKLDPNAMAELSRLRNESKEWEGGLPLAGVELTSITVDAKPMPKEDGGGKAPSRPKKEAEPGRTDDTRKAPAR